MGRSLEVLESQLGGLASADPGLKADSILAIFGKWNFTRQESDGARQMVKRGLPITAIGGAFHVAECNEAWYFAFSKPEMLRYMEFYDSKRLDNQIWTYVDYILWKFLVKLRLTKKGICDFLVPEEGCLENFKLMVRPLAGLDDFGKVRIPILNSLLSRSDFQATELHMAIDLLDYRSYQLHTPCVHVILSTMTKDELREWFNTDEAKKKRVDRFFDRERKGLEKRLGPIYGD